MEWSKHLSDKSTDSLLESVDQFLAEWYGAWRPEFALELVDGDGGSHLPRPLLWWYSTHGCRPGVITYNHLAGPDDEWEPQPDAPTLGSRRLFLSENQGVFIWSHSLDGDDPAVYVSLNEKGGEWIEEGERLSGFLLQLLLWEAAGPLSTSADWINAECYQRLTSQFRSLPLAPWHWPEWKTEFFAEDDAIAIGYPAIDPQYHHVRITAHSRRLIDEIRPLIPKENWDNP